MFGPGSEDVKKLPTALGHLAADKAQFNRDGRIKLNKILFW
jgi:hypothetical protein